MDLYRLEFHPTQYPWHYANPERDNEGTHGWRTIGLGSGPKLNLFTYSIDKYLKDRTAKSLGLSYSDILIYWRRFETFNEKILGVGTDPTQINKVCDLTWRTEKIQKREFENAFDMWNENHSVVSEDHLYFIKAGVNIKIGRSINVFQRLTQLKTGIAEEPQILHIEENKGCIENNLHKIFEDTRVRKDCEWFRESKHLNEFILYLSRGGKNF